MLDVMAYACNPNIWVTFRKLILSACLIYQFFGFEYSIEIMYEIEFISTWLWYMPRYAYVFIFPGCLFIFLTCLPLRFTNTVEK